MLNERAKKCGKKPNLMKNAKILKGIQAEEEILKIFRPNEKPFTCKEIFKDEWGCNYMG